MSADERNSLDDKSPQNEEDDTNETEFFYVKQTQFTMRTKRKVYVKQTQFTIRTKRKDYVKKTQFWAVSKTKTFYTTKQE